MDFLTFTDVNYLYLDDDSVDLEGKPIKPSVIFDHFSACLPTGFVSLVGPNGSGKSTFMLLASARLLPLHGIVTLFGQDTKTLSETERDKLASFIYQNMELETDEKLSDLLNFVYKNGLLKGNAPSINSENTNLYDEVVSIFELNSLLDKKVTGMSKGEMQRAYLAFSLLYGSKSVFMDEPFFALEDKQKEAALSYIKSFCKKTNTTIYISMHELDLTRKYAETVMLFYPNHDIDLGTVEEVLTNEALEKAYKVPASMLKHTEDMSREQIKSESEMLRKQS